MWVLEIWTQISLLSEEAFSLHWAIYQPLNLSSWYMLTTETSTYVNQPTFLEWPSLPLSLLGICFTYFCFCTAVCWDRFLFVDTWILCSPLLLKEHYNEQPDSERLCECRLSFEERVLQTPLLDAHCKSHGALKHTGTAGTWAPAQTQCPGNWSNPVFSQTDAWNIMMLFIHDADNIPGH